LLGDVSLLAPSTKAVRNLKGFPSLNKCLLLQLLLRPLAFKFTAGSCSTSTVNALRYRTVTGKVMLKVSNYERVVRSTTVELDCEFALLACALHSYECLWLGFLLFALLRMHWQEVFVSFEKSEGASFGHWHPITEGVYCTTIQVS
jgi:hypothetical protein